MFEWLFKPAGHARSPASTHSAADQLVTEGNRAEREGRLREACDLYRKAVATAPGWVKAHLNLGIGLEAVGEADAAVAAYEAALAIDSTDPYVNYNLGRLLYTRGALELAKVLLLAALERKPDFVDAQVVLSNIYDAQGNLPAAAGALEVALRLRPDYTGALRNYGMVLTRLARWAEAEAPLRRAIAGDTADADAHYWLGNALAGRGDLEGARDCYRKATELRPDFAEAWCNLGNVHTDWGLRDDAERYLTRALEIRPNFPEALSGLGNLHAAAERFDAAADCYRKAMDLDPGIPDAHVNLGHVLKNQGRAREALECYRAAITLKPEFVGARWALAMGRIPAVPEPSDDPRRIRAEFTAELDGLDRWLDEARAADGYRAVGVQQPFWLAYREDDNRDLLQRYGRLCARLMARWQEQQSLKPVAPHAPGVVRVGIVSAQLREHSVWNAIVKGWFQHLDSQRFELVAFCLTPEQDAETLFARSRAARFEQAAGGLRQWVDAIIDARPDVLIYPEIGMDPMTVKLASLRLAPVQVASWGHPETTGLPTIDYYLSAEDLEPEGAQANYTERLVALPHLGCFVERARVEARIPDLGAWGIDGGVPLLLCPGTPFKYAPQHDWIFPEIARRLTRCRFIFFTHRLTGLSEKLSRRLEAEFARSGLDFEDFVSFVPWQDKAGFYGLMERADVFLDTIGFSGFNTALQAVECGLPIVTREGRFMRGRLASGILKRMGLTELVVSTEQDYVALAARLGRDAEYRGRIRARIAESSDVLFEDLAPIRALEAFLSEARAGTV
jgi:predicted O-linked N-acetylglucosamine transferase (SPINDLY family)